MNKYGAVAYLADVSDESVAAMVAECAKAAMKVASDHDLTKYINIYINLEDLMPTVAWKVG